MSSLTKIVLGDYIDVITDYHANGAYEKLKENICLKYEPNFAIMIRTLNFESNNFKSNLIYLNEDEYNYLSKTKVRPYDLIMNKIASPGSVYLMPDLNRPVTLAMNLFLIRFSKKVDQKFMFYLMKINEPYIKRFANGTTTKTITKDAVRALNFAIPSLITQKQISSILFNIDAKIELNNRINRELEAMAKTLYDYWFVQFDFPCPEPAEGPGKLTGKPYKSSGGKMLYNAELKREIPEGWEVKTLAKWIIKDKNGDWGKESKEGNYQLKVSCVRGADLNGLNGNGELKSPTRFILENNSNKLLENHDLIVEISGGSPTQSTGRLAFITEETLQRFSNPLICSNFCKALTLKEEKYLYNFVYQWNRLYDNGVLFGWEGKTSGIKNLLFESFVTNHKEVYPNLKIVEKFYDFMKPLHAQKQKNLIQNQQLTELRDWLLPMLMNGQVTVASTGSATKLPVPELVEGMAAEPSEKYKTKGNYNTTNKK